MPLTSRLSKPNLQTKSVDSVRSPVSNLQSAKATLTHKDFVSAVTAEFDQYFTQGRAGDMKPQAILVDESRILQAGDERSRRLRDGMDELRVRYMSAA